MLSSGDDPTRRNAAGGLTEGKSFLSDATIDRKEPTQPPRDWTSLLYDWFRSYPDLPVNSNVPDVVVVCL